MNATLIKQPSKQFAQEMADRGFSIQDCPACEIQPEWEQMPIIKAIREAEKVTGEKFQ